MSEVKKPDNAPAKPVFYSLLDAEGTVVATGVHSFGDKLSNQIETEVPPVAGQIYKNGYFVNPEPNKEGLKRIAARLRFKHETGSLLELNNIKFHAHDSQFHAADRVHGDDGEFHWRASDGTWHMPTAAELTEMKTVAAAHHAAWAAAHRAVDDAINAGTIKTIADIRAFNWPDKKD